MAYGDEISALLPYTISNQDLEIALNNFVGIDNVSVIGGPSQRTVTFGGTQSNVNMPPIRADGGNLNAGTPLRTISTAYNSNSEVVSVSDPSSTINYSRDNLGRVTTIANTYSSAVANTSFTQSFDAVGNRTELRAAIGANLDFKNTYTYDKLQRLTDIVQAGQTGGNAVAAKHVAFNYNTLSQLTKISRYQSTGTANPVATTDFTFDTANRLSGISHKQGATDLNTYAYTYDRMSRLSTVNSTAEGLTSYSYDQVSQLIGATNTFGNDETYGYDKNGNRNTAGYTVDTDNRTTSSPAAQSTPAYNYLYDDEGNITRRQNAATLASTYYAYDHRNRLVSVSGQQNPISYEYDAYNRLVSRSNVATRIFWSYDTGINPVLEFDISQSPALTHRYLWSNSVDELLADEKVTSTSSAGNTLWGLADHLGTIRDIADANEATGVTSVVNHRRYNAFGKLMSQTGAVDMIFGYTGKYSDAATGLQNNLNRWYDPNLGKWISQDPIGFGGGDTNLYRYVGNSVTNAKDPSGLFYDDGLEFERGWGGFFWDNSPLGFFGGSVASWHESAIAKGNLAGGLITLESNTDIARRGKAQIIANMADRHYDERLHNDSTAGATGRLDVYDEYREKVVPELVRQNFNFQAAQAGMASGMGGMPEVPGGGNIGKAKAQKVAVAPVNGPVHISSITGRAVDLGGRIRQVKPANGPTRFTPLRDNGNPVAAGLDHVRARHFGGNNTQSQFTITVNELKQILQGKTVRDAPITQIGTGRQAMWSRDVDVGQIVGTTRKADGALPTSRIRVFVDEAGNLITTFPIP